MPESCHGRLAARLNASPEEVGAVTAAAAAAVGVGVARAGVAISPCWF